MKYIVYYSFYSGTSWNSSHGNTYEIDADSEEDAREKFNDHFSFNVIDDYSIERIDLKK